MNKPYAPSCEENKKVILDELKPRFSDRQSVLEIGSGTGQHAVYFAREMAHLRWQCTDRSAECSGISQWLQDAQLANTPEVICLDVQDAWPDVLFDAVFTANTLHIMHKPMVEAFFRGIGLHMPNNGKCIVYGAMNYQGNYTSQSNADFDQWLKARDPESGIKDFEWVQTLALNAGLELLEDIVMPANNRLLYWRKL